MDNIVIELFLLSIGASFVQRTTGFGFGIFIMTMLPNTNTSLGADYCQSFSHSS